MCKPWSVVEPSFVYAYRVCEPFLLHYGLPGLLHKQKITLVRHQQLTQLRTLSAYPIRALAYPGSVSIIRCLCNHTTGLIRDARLLRGDVVI